MNTQSSQATANTNQAVKANAMKSVNKTTTANAAKDSQPTVKKVNKPAETKAPAVPEIESSRHFYARKPLATGDAAYCFDKKGERDEWVNKNAEAEIISAMDAYKIVKYGGEKGILMSNRKHRLTKISDVSEVKPEKGHKLIIYSV